MLTDLRACPQSLVVESADEAFVLNFALCRSWVDAPLVWGAEFLKNPFGNEGDDDFLALNPGGRWPHGCSFPFMRDVDGDGIVLGLLGHEDGMLRLGTAEGASLRLVGAFLRLACLFAKLNKTRMGSLFLIY